MPSLSPNIIGQIALMQSVVVQLPTIQSVLDLVCRGFSDIPGVSTTSYDLNMNGTEIINNQKKRSYSIGSNAKVYAHIFLTLKDFEAFEIYEPYIKNFCVILAVVFDERRQKDENKRILAGLEKIVDERTRELNKYKNELESLVLERTKELEETVSDLEKTQKKLVETKKLASLTNIVTGIAHELNTPLGVIITASTYLVDMIKSVREDFLNHKLTEKKFKEYLESLQETDQIIIKNSNIANDLILGFKNIVLDKTNEIKEEVDLERLIQDFISDVKVFNSNITFHVICHQNIIINSYPEALSQVFSNLIINSLKHGFRERSEGCINIELILKNSTVKILYSDDGLGIDESMIEHLFDPFYTTKLGEGRSGLGLFIVYNIISQTLNSSIRINKNRDVGIEFEIEFPTS